MLSGKYKYQRDYFTSSQFADAKSFVSPVHLYRLMLETSCLQLHEHYTSVEELKDQRYAYVLSKVDVIFHRPAKIYENLRLSTWARSSSILKLFRNFTVEDENGLIAEASTLWAGISLDSRKLVKTSDIPDPVQCFELDVNADSNRRIFMPEGLLHVMDKKVIYSDIDLYDHMNNTKYVELICDVLPLSEKRLKSLRIDFLHECTLGCELKVYFLEKDGEYFVRGVRGDCEVAFNCHATLE